MLRFAGDAEQIRSDISEDALLELVTSWHAELVGAGASLDQIADVGATVMDALFRDARLPHELVRVTIGRAYELFGVERYPLMANDLSKTTYYELLASYEELLQGFGNLLIVTAGLAEHHHQGTAPTPEVLKDILEQCTRAAAGLKEGHERVAALKAQIPVH